MEQPEKAKEVGMDVVGTTGTLISIAKDTGILEKIKGFFFKNRREAARQLSIALGEIGRFYEALDLQLSKLLSVTAYPNMPPEIKQTMWERLNELDSPTVKIKLAQAGSSCAIIENIYNTHLNPLFQDIADIGEDDRNKLHQLFFKLNAADDILKEQGEEIAKWIGKTAEKARESMKEDKFDELSSIIEEAREQTKELRQKTAKVIARMYKLQNRFIKVI